AGGDFRSVLSQPRQGIASISRAFGIGGSLSQVSVSVAPRWNLVSAPIAPDDSSVTSLFPDASSNAFAYTSSGYQVRSHMGHGIGYWLKFPSEESVTLIGSRIDKDSLSVAEGWNLIGSLSTGIPVSSITSDPPGMVTGSFYGYDGAYGSTDTLFPGG